MAASLPASSTSALANIMAESQHPQTRRRTKSSTHDNMGNSGSGIDNKATIHDARTPEVGAPGLGTSLAHFNVAHAQSKDSKDSKRFSKRRKARSLLRRAKSFAIKHTWALPLVMLSVLGMLYSLNPTESNPAHHCIFLSYRLPAADGERPLYGKGWWDYAFVAFYTLLLTFTREFIMHKLLHPLARRAGIRSRAKQARFMEQVYSALYFGLLGPAGMYVMSRTPVWYFNTRAMYEDFPHLHLDASFKFYYLFQAAYWAQQAIVLILGMEKPRKDFRELIGHHIVSLSLIALSYRFHFTRIGIAIFTTHDISDFFLATSKTLNYLDHFLVAPYFAIFMCSWIYLRHYLNLRIIYSLFTEFRTVGPYGMDWENEQFKGQIAFIITFTLLAALQALNLFWLCAIFRIAYRFLAYNIAEDDRSEAEESDGEDATNDVVAEKPPLKPTSPSASDVAAPSSAHPPRA